MNFTNHPWKHHAAALLTAGVMALPTSALAAVIGYEFTYNVAELSMSNGGNTGDASESAFWGLIGASGPPRTIGFRIEMSQDPADIQTYTLSNGGTPYAEQTYYEFARIDLLLNGEIVGSDLTPPAADGTILVNNAFPDASNFSDQFFMSYRSEFDFGLGTVAGISFSFTDSFAAHADTWLTGTELPSADQLTSLTGPPALRIDFVAPASLNYVLSNFPDYAAPVITEINSISAVPLPASLPLLAFGGAAMALIGRKRRKS